MAPLSRCARQFQVIEDSGRFLKKAAQKLLVMLGRAVETSTAQSLKKFFAAFFKKEALSFA